MDKDKVFRTTAMLLPLLISILMLTHLITSDGAKAIARGECVIQWGINRSKEYTGLWGDCSYLNKYINKPIEEPTDYVELGNGLILNTTTGRIQNGG